MKFNQIKTSNELLEFMKANIEYGICDKDGSKYRTSDTNFNETCNQKWRLSSPKELLNNKMGICWDYVELEREWFLKHNYNFKTIFVMFFNTNLPTHTFLAYEEDGKWKWFESSDFKNQGIHEFNSYKELIYMQKLKHLEYVKSFCNVDNELINNLHIIEYGQPNYGCNSKEFINFIVDYGNDITNKIISGIFKS